MQIVWPCHETDGRCLRWKLVSCGDQILAQPDTRLMFLSVEFGQCNMICDLLFIPFIAAPAWMRNLLLFVILHKNQSRQVAFEDVCL